MLRQPLKIIVLLLIAAFWGSLLITQIEFPQGNDISRHVKNGELILHGNFDVLTSNVYSYTMPGQRFVNHHWLSGVVFYIVQSTAGWDGLVIFKALVLLAAFILLFATAARKSDFWLAAIFSIPAIFLLSERTLARPEIFSILFVALYLYLLTSFDADSSGKRIYWLIPLQILWVNLHIFFVFGIVLLGVFIFEKMVLSMTKRRTFKKGELKKWLTVLGLMIVACLTNPNGIKGALAPLNIMMGYGFDVLENEPLSYFLKYEPLQQNYRIVFVAVCIVLLLISFLVNFKRTNIFYLILSVATAFGAVKMIRLMPFFGLVFLPAVCINFKIVFERIRSVKIVLPAAYKGAKYAFIAVFSLLLVCLIYQGSEGKITDKRKPGLGLTARSQDAINFFKSENLKGPIFNDYDIGGYLIYNLYPTEKVFTDNRPEAYSADFFDHAYWPIILDENVWHAAMAKYQFNVLFFEQYDLSTRVIQFLDRRSLDSTWALVYADRYAMIFLRNTPENKKTVDAHAITLQNAQEKMKSMLNSDDINDRIAACDILNFVGRPDLAAMNSFDIAIHWPDKGQVWKVMGQLELTAQGAYTPILASMFLDKAISVGWKTADTYTSLAEAYLKLGKKDKAEEALQKALKINPDYQNAQDLMKQVHR